MILKRLPGDDSSPFTAVVCVRHATTADFIHVDTLSRVINLFHCALCVCEREREKKNWNALHRHRIEESRKWSERDSISRIDT